MSSADVFTLGRRWWRKPLQVATWSPSSPSLCRALIQDVNRDDDGWVIELGAGTGPVTQALLAAGVCPERLLAVEADPVFCQRLWSRFGPDCVACHDAADLAALYQQRGVTRIQAIVSTLPILNMPRCTQKAVLDGAFSRADGRTTMTQITYFPGSPVRQCALKRWGYVAAVADRSLRNLPPSTIWRYARTPALDG